MLQRLVVLLGFIATFAIALPAVNKDVINRNPLKESVGFLTLDPKDKNSFQKIHEVKELLEFFDQLKESRSSKSVSIVGKDDKYIYLVVADDTGDAGRDGMATKEVSIIGSNKRTKRGLDTLVGNTLNFIGPSGVRHASVAISLLHFLGYMPVRIPGIRYFMDTGSPEKRGYNYINTFPNMKQPQDYEDEYD